MAVQSASEQEHGQFLELIREVEQPAAQSNGSPEER